MNLELTSEECALLKKLLEREITEINPELHHTRTASYRDQLKDYKQDLKKLYDRLCALSPS